ncbi:uncharacterized protein L969DRAFT_15762 [Mixia osmundae IAM 14324]|uniref:Uncharacterized protein n=1 Tax=Mixia osmundae (strain CBS 9802 / IAM 14324 / JCM 22182 / KY 12970) TaxID=764103 RepID=G7DTX3_MIXOS|nr:uncharacterized protein L969DRAFT_15762 [Mixia osmundae IAM 14324]KEI41746.1 hypothetical protein L969DRAFT_15762 [Mixia osmundae IAM 14324]GAA94033.1 hypothetical protein E5Q_00680 [Mixia osmundae IAM 14324]
MDDADDSFAFTTVPFGAQTPRNTRNGVTTSSSTARPSTTATAMPGTSRQTLPAVQSSSTHVHNGTSRLTPWQQHEERPVGPSSSASQAVQALSTRKRQSLDRRARRSSAYALPSPLEPPAMPVVPTPRPPKPAEQRGYIAKTVKESPHTAHLADGRLYEHIDPRLPQDERAQILLTWLVTRFKDRALLAADLSASTSEASTNEMALRIIQAVHHDVTSRLVDLSPARLPVLQVQERQEALDRRGAPSQRNLTNKAKKITLQEQQARFQAESLARIAKFKSYGVLKSSADAYISAADRLTAELTSVDISCPLPLLAGSSDEMSLQVDAWKRRAGALPSSSPSAAQRLGIDMDLIRNDIAHARVLSHRIEQCVDLASKYIEARQAQNYRHLRHLNGLADAAISRQHDADTGDAFMTGISDLAPPADGTTLAEDPVHLLEAVSQGV